MKTDIQIEKPYLLIPVVFGGENKRISFYCDNEKVMEFAIPIDPARAEVTWERDFYGTYIVRDMIGKTLTLEGDMTEAFVQAIRQSDERPENDAMHPFVHFAPQVGWMNDPNGLVYDGKNYLLYFQHNPFGKLWENMTWGHAVSDDLIHWTQMDEVLYPDALGTMFSGSGMPDKRNTLGLGEDTTAFVYTAAGGYSDWTKGRNSVQCLAHSTDGGATLVKDGVILETLGDGNRDPKVYWHEKSGHYYMILFVTEPDQFAVFTSDDLKNWTKTQDLVIPGLRECPDLRQIPVENEPETEAYVLMAADGTYVTGTFDGSAFTIESGIKYGFMTSLPYAAQTFNGPDRVILLPWLRTHDPKKPYTSTMGIPRVLTLKRDASGDLLLNASIAEELDDAMVKAEQIYLDPFMGEEVASATYNQQRAGALEVEYIAPGDALASFEMTVYDTDILYDAENHTMTILGVYSEEADREIIALKPENKGYDPQKPTIRVMKDLAPMKEVSIIVDGSILEITPDNGREVWIYELNKELYGGSVDLGCCGPTFVNVKEFR